MSGLSKVMEKHANPGKWRESHEGWVGNKGTQFPSLTRFTPSKEKQDNATKSYHTMSTLP